MLGRADELLDEGGDSERRLANDESIHRRGSMPSRLREEHAAEAIKEISALYSRITK